MPLIGSVLDHHASQNSRVVDVVRARARSLISLLLLLQGPTRAPSGQDVPPRRGTLLCLMSFFAESAQGCCQIAHERTHLVAHLYEYSACARS
jgi:hypothetical protein